MEETVREMSAALGFNLPEERIQPLAEALKAVLAQLSEIRTEPTPAQVPAPFDPAWEVQS